MILSKYPTNVEPLSLQLVDPILVQLRFLSIPILVEMDFWTSRDLVQLGKLLRVWMLSISFMLVMVKVLLLERDLTRDYCRKKVMNTLFPAFLSCLIFRKPLLNKLSVQIRWLMSLSTLAS